MDIKSVKMPISNWADFASNDICPSYSDKIKSSSPQWTGKLKNYSFSSAALLETTTKFNYGSNSPTQMHLLDGK